MELRHLRYFLAVAHEQNFTAAANLMCVSQPALSKQIKDLEEEIGKPLFIRGSKIVQLTGAGLFLKQRAEDILELSNRTLTELKADEAEITGEINVVCGEIEGVSFVAQAIKKMNRRYPKVKFNMTTGDEETVRYQLDKGIADFGMFVDLTVLPNYECISVPIASPWGVMTWKGNRLAKKKFATPKDLLNMPLILSRQMRNNNTLATWLGYSTDKLNVVGTNDMLYNASKLAEAEVASVITIDGIINTRGTKLCFVPFKPLFPIKVAVAWKKNRIATKACEKFLEILREMEQKPISRGFFTKSP